MAEYIKKGSPLCGHEDKDCSSFGWSCSALHSSSLSVFSSRLKRFSFFILQMGKSRMGRTGLAPESQAPCGLIWSGNAGSSGSGAPVISH